MDTKQSPTILGLSFIGGGDGGGPLSGSVFQPILILAIPF